MKLSLYQIEKDYIDLASQLIEAGGEATEEMEQALAINQQNLETKATNYGFVIKQLDAETEMIDAEIKRLQALKSSRNKTIDRLKDAVSKAMDLYEIEEVKTPVLKINFRKSESIEIEDESLLSTEFLETKTTITPNKTKIKEAIKKGEFVVGAVLKSNKNLQIK